MTTIEVPPARREAARELSIAARGDFMKIRANLVLPYHDDLRLELVTGSHWFYQVTADGLPATWDVVWVENVSTSDDMFSKDYQEEERHECGDFYDLRSRVKALLKHKRRVPDSPVDVNIHEWAMHFQLPTLNPAPDCLRPDRH
jgi:hypothetical protein